MAPTPHPVHVCVHLSDSLASPIAVFSRNSTTDCWTATDKAFRASRHRAFPRLPSNMAEPASAPFCCDGVRHRVLLPQ